MYAAVCHSEQNTWKKYYVIKTIRQSWVSRTLPWNVEFVMEIYKLIVWTP